MKLDIEVVKREQVTSSDYVVLANSSLWLSEDNSHIVLNVDDQEKAIRINLQEP